MFFSFSSNLVKFYGQFVALFELLQLSSFCIGCNSFAEAMMLAEQGDDTNIDLLVKDIFGGDYSQYGLKGDICAASFGKLCSVDTDLKSVRKEDLARACLALITNNIGSLANLYATQVCQIPQIIFVGQ
jgi:type II pantothenate kinase